MRHCPSTLPVILVLTIFSFALTAQTPFDRARAAEPVSAEQAKAERTAPLSASDKKFIREATKDLHYELALVDKCLRKNRAVTVTTDPAMEVGRKLHPQLKQLWDELAAVAQAHNERVADELTGNAENTVDRLRALNDEKFNKEVLTLLAKETKSLARTFQSLSTGHPALKRIVQTYAPQLKEHAIEVESAVSKLK
jgi:hypothetical protein